MKLSEIYKERLALDKYTRAIKGEMIIKVGLLTLLIVFLTTTCTGKCAEGVYEAGYNQSSNYVR